MGSTGQGAHALTDAVALGRRIHDLRASRGFSLQEFAMLSGLSAPVLSALERGEDTSPLSALFAVAEALELSAAALFADAPTSPAAAHEREAPPRGYVPEAPPRGYVPLEVPEPWEPPAPAASSAPVPVLPPAPVVAAPAGPVPRTFADLRVGVLADRSFATLPEFAVAAVVEAGHAVSVIASIFRVPSWRLEGWVRDGVSAPRAQPSFPRRR